MTAEAVQTAIMVAVREEAAALLRRMRRTAHSDQGQTPVWDGTLGGKRIAVARSGMGAERSGLALRDLAAHRRPSQVLITGFCGGISEWAGSSDLVLAEYVMDWPDFPGTTDYEQPRRTLHPDPRLLGIARELAVPGVHVTVGGMLTVGTLVSTTGIKGYHGPRAARCRALDMETAGAVAVAEEYGIPWIAVRAVTDTIEEDLPMPFNEFTTEAGELSRGRILAAALRNPSVLPPLFRLGRQSMRAARNLAAFAEAFVAAT